MARIFLCVVLLVCLMACRAPDSMQEAAYDDFIINKSLEVQDAFNEMTELAHQAAQDPAMLDSVDLEEALSVEVARISAVAQDVEEYRVVPPRYIAVHATFKEITTRYKQIAILTQQGVLERDVSKIAEAKRLANEAVALAEDLKSQLEELAK